MVWDVIAWSVAGIVAMLFAVFMVWMFFVIEEVKFGEWFNVVLFIIYMCVVCYLGGVWSIVFLVWFFALMGLHYVLSEIFSVDVDEIMGIGYLCLFACIHALAVRGMF